MTRPVSDGDPPWAAEALAAGWLPPAEAEFTAWRAANMNRDSCRWCGAIRARGQQGHSWWKRSEEPMPHRPSCRFHDGPVKHAFVNGHYGTFDYWIACSCGRSYPQHDAEGNEQECPDREMTWRHPQARDLLAERLQRETEAAGDRSGE